MVLHSGVTIFRLSSYSLRFLPAQVHHQPVHLDHLDKAATQGLVTVELVLSVGAMFQHGRTPDLVGT